MAMCASQAKLVGPDGTQLTLPDEVYRVLRGVVDAMSRGLAITVAPHNTQWGLLVCWCTMVLV